MAGIEVDLSGIPDASTVYGQPFQLEEVFSNLFQFAQRSMGGEGKIQISAMEEGDVVSIRFRDSKSGLDPDGFEQLFSPVGMGSEAFGRVGMELPISWGIIQEHQSVLRVKNVDGGGMEFSFSLAKSPAIPPSGSPTRSESPAQQVDGAFELRVLCVLCVEDELHLLELIEAYLGNMGCKVIPARTRHEALQALDSQAIAGVISDLSLADGSGVELLQEIAEKCPHLEGKMLLISGSSSTLQGTNYPVLNKPFRMQRLWEIVQAWESRDPSVQ